MTSSFRNLGAACLFTFCLAMPQLLPAASTCYTTQLNGVYNVEATNVAVQNLLKPLPSNPPTTTAGTVIGFTSNPNSLSGSVPGLGRYYLDGTGNVVGMTVAASNTPAVSTNIGKYSVNTDCSGNITLTSGAAYDIYLAGNGSTINYVRTDASSGGELGVLTRVSACVNLNYPGTFTFTIEGNRVQTPTGGTAAQGIYSTIGSLSLNGSGMFTMSQSLYNASGIQRSTSSGTYTVGGDCSVSLSFSSATGASSSNFVAPTSFKLLMIDATTGFISTQPDSTTTLTGTLIAQ
jgi:hypothetical protein